MISRAERTRLIREEALRLGFESCGFAAVQQLDTEARRLEQWLLEGRHGTMSWMENHFDKRIDPGKLVPGAKTVISVLLNYYHRDTAGKHASLPYRISKYALADDYHDVLKEKLFALFRFIETTFGAVEGRAFTDSAPVMDKAWAVRSGLGWQGKNSMLLNKNAGSFFFLGELILDLECDYDTPLKDLCGSCTRCIDACPTGAIYGPGKVDGSKCISYFTIELRNEIPAEYHEKLGNWMYGCDICQDVCPWNRRAPDTKEPRFAPRQELISADESLWKELNLEEYRRMFKGSAVKRTKFEGLSRNIAIVTSNRKKESEPHHE